MPPRRSRTLVFAGSILALSLAAQWLLFGAYVQREIAWAYPPHFDQTMSLFTAYRTYEDVREHGLVSGLGRTLRNSPASGATLHIEAVLLFLGVGPSRLAALAVNWLHFALLQAAVVAALWTHGRWEMPVLGLGLLLSVNTPFYWAGGMADFRPDFVAFCLYGTFLAVVWKSDVFRRHVWALLAGAVGTLCVLARSLTAVYLGMLLGGCLAVLSVLWLCEHDPTRRVERRRQLVGVALCAACLCLLALPALAVQARTLWNVLRRRPRDRPGARGACCGHGSTAGSTRSLSIPARRSSITAAGCSCRYRSRASRCWLPGGVLRASRRNRGAWVGSDRGAAPCPWAH